jgi:1-acyl-sn-glycerol-3-phosphate acyltransferase
VCGGNRLIRHTLLKVLCSVFRLLFFLLTRVNTEGLEYLPRTGGYIVAANHLSILEVPLVYCLLGRDDVRGLVAKKHQKNPIFRWIINIIGGIWLNREEADTRAIRAARDHLKQGGVLGISPEGTRSPTGALIAAKNGVAYLADQAGVPIIPVAIIGTWKVTSKLLTLQRPPILVRFGEPFSLPKVERADREDGLQHNTDEIMSRIAALLPQKYRGVYADHPRVRELLGIEARI